jgi:hypothetical protein
MTQPPVDVFVFCDPAAGGLAAFWWIVQLIHWPADIGSSFDPVRDLQMVKGKVAPHNVQNRATPL